MPALLELLAIAALFGAAFLLLAALLQRRGGGPTSGADGLATRAATAEQQLAAAEQRAAAADARAEAVARETGALVELIGVGVVRVSADLTVSVANEAAHRLGVRRPGTIVGRGLLEAFTDHHIEEIARAALETGAAVGELTVRTSDGPTLLVRARRTPAGDAWLVLEDVTELRRLQRIRAEFIDNLSHELRTPLTTVSLLAEALAADAASLPPKAADRVATIEVETGHLVQMVNELLDLSRIESGSATLAVADVDLAALAVSTSARLRLFAERSGVTIAVEAPAGIPPVRGDGERLGQALLNLLHNAVKFSPPGATVTVTVAAGEHEVVVSVADEGPGIPRSALPRVFERFYKVDRARTRGAGGTGLGLSIARHVVEAHGGRIWVESEEGAGSLFAFAIPVVGPEIAATPGG